MKWRFDNERPIYQQIADKLTCEIISGEYPPDSRIKSVRELAAEASVNPNTMQHALTDLEATGIIYTLGTSGKFVTSDQAVLSTAKKRLFNAAKKSYFERCKLLGLDEQQAKKMINEGECE